MADPTEAEYAGGAATLTDSAGAGPPAAPPTAIGTSGTPPDGRHRRGIVASIAIGVAVGVAWGLALWPVIFLMLALGFGMIADAGPLTLPILFKVSPYIAPVAGVAAALVARYGWSRGRRQDGMPLLAAIASPVLAACLGWLAGLYIGIGVTVAWVFVAKLLGSRASIETMSYGAILGAVAGVWLVLRRPARG